MKNTILCYVAVLMVLATSVSAQINPERMERIKKRAEEENLKHQEERKQEESPIKGTFKDGFKLKSEDGNFDAHIGGRFLEHARFIFDRPDSSRTSADTFFVRQARLEMSGKMFKNFEFKVQADFPTGTSSTSGTLQDAYIGMLFSPEFNIRFGQFKEPFSQEETTSTRFIDFVERSNLNRLAPARDIGIMAHGTFMGGMIQYEIGIFNGQGRAVLDGNDEKDFAARINVTPFKGGMDMLKGLRIGIATTLGDQDARSFSDVSSTETATTFLDIDSAVVIEGEIKRMGIDLSWLYGPLGVRGEYVTADFDLLEGTVKDTIEAKAWYLAATYLLTGENKTLENRIVPKSPFDVSKGGTGAFELTARMAVLEYDDDLFARGYAATLGNTNKVTGVTAGVNWYLTRNYRITANYVNHKYDDDILTGTAATDSQKGILLRFQIDF